MSARLVRIADDPGSDPAVAEAAALLRSGELVAFPTETVYGLGGDALSPRAVERIFEAKGRPADNPLIVHVADADALGLVAASVPDAALRLAAAFWPGPLTLVLPAREEARRAAARGLPTVAVRVPAHPVALALLRAAGIPVAAPSANVSGRPSPTRASDVAADLGDRIPLILDGGPCAVGVESTVLDLSGTRPAILRPGAVSAAEIGAVLGAEPPIAGEADLLRRSPGTRHRHYSPRARVVLLGPAVSAAAALRMASRLGRWGYVGSRPELLSASGAAAIPAGAGLARELYARLRDLDEAGVDAIVADAVPEEGLGVALMDRLRRAASARVLDDREADALR